jgi:hypothetical protein
MTKLTRDDVYNSGGRVYEIENFKDGYRVKVTDKDGVVHYLPENCDIDFYDTKEWAANMMMNIASVVSCSVMTILPNDLNTDEWYSRIQVRGPLKR